MTDENKIIVRNPAYKNIDTKNIPGLLKLFLENNKDHNLKMFIVNCFMQIDLVSTTSENLGEIFETIKKYLLDNKAEDYISCSADDWFFYEDDWSFYEDDEYAPPLEFVGLRSQCLKVLERIYSSSNTPVNFKEEIFDIIKISLSSLSSKTIIYSPNVKKYLVDDEEDIKEDTDFKTNCLRVLEQISSNPNTSEKLLRDIFNLITQIIENPKIFQPNINPLHTISILEQNILKQISSNPNTSEKLLQDIFNLTSNPNTFDRDKFISISKCIGSNTNTSEKLLRDIFNLITQIIENPEIHHQLNTDILNTISVLGQIGSNPNTSEKLIQDIFNLITQIIKNPKIRQSNTDILNTISVLGQIGSNPNTSKKLIHNIINLINKIIPKLKYRFDEQIFADQDLKSIISVLIQITSNPNINVASLQGIINIIKSQEKINKPATKSALQQVISKEADLVSANGFNINNEIELSFFMKNFSSLLLNPLVDDLGYQKLKNSFAYVVCNMMSYRNQSQKINNSIQTQLQNNPSEEGFTPPILSHISSSNASNQDKEKSELTPEKGIQKEILEKNIPEKDKGNSQSKDQKVNQNIL